MASPTFQLQVAFATPDPFAASPAWTDVSADLIDASVTRGRQRELDRCDAGQATFTLDNSSWQYLPGYTSALYSPNLLPGRRIQLNVTVSGTVYSLFTGYINRFEVDWTDPSLSTVKITATDALSLFTLGALQASFPKQLTSARVAAILNQIGWPAAATNIRVGAKSCPAKAWAYTDNQTAGAALAQTADTEPGTLYVDGGGIVNFYSGFVGSVSLGAVGDRSDLGEVLIDGGMLSLSDDNLWNDLRGTRDGGTGEVRIQSSSSQAEWRNRQATKSTYATDDTALTAALTSFLQRYQYPAQLFDPITVMPVGDVNSAFAFCCKAELGALLTVNRTPPAATGLPRFSQTCVVNYVQHDIKAGTGQDWTTTLRLAGAQSH